MHIIRKVGRQIVIWGRSESLRVLDVLNPLDNREAGRVDIEDLRRPLAMVRVDAYQKLWDGAPGPNGPGNGSGSKRERTRTNYFLFVGRSWPRLAYNSTASPTYPEPPVFGDPTS